MGALHQKKWRKDRPSDRPGTRQGDGGARGAHERRHLPTFASGDLSSIHLLLWRRVAEVGAPPGEQGGGSRQMGWSRTRRCFPCPVGAWGGVHPSPVGAGGWPGRGGGEEGETRRCTRGEGAPEEG